MPGEVQALAHQLETQFSPVRLLQVRAAVLPQALEPEQEWEQPRRGGTATAPASTSRRMTTATSPASLEAALEAAASSVLLPLVVVLVLVLVQLATMALTTTVSSMKWTQTS